jgi:hypothetical protein
LEITEHFQLIAKAATGYVTGKIRQPYATAAGSGIPAQLEMAILVANARGLRVHLAQASGNVPLKDVRIGKHLSRESS